MYTSSRLPCETTQEALWTRRVLTHTLTLLDKLGNIKFRHEVVLERKLIPHKHGIINTLAVQWLIKWINLPPESRHLRRLCIHPKGISYVHASIESRLSTPGNCRKPEIWRIVLLKTKSLNGVVTFILNYPSSIDPSSGWWSSIGRPYILQRSHFAFR